MSVVSELGPDGRPSFTLKESAQRCSVSVSTIRRRHENSAFPQAFKGNKGEWRIPVSDLIAAGFTLSRPMVSEGERAQDERVSEVIESPQSKRERELERQVSEAEQRAAVAEARLQEQERTLAAYAQTAEDLRNSLRMLSPGPPVSRHEHNQNQEDGQKREQRPGWRQRLRGKR